MKSFLGAVFSALLYVVMFLLMQVAACVAVVIPWYMSKGKDLQFILDGLKSGNVGTDPTMLVLVSAAGSVLIILLFLLARWCKVSRSYLLSRPWAVFFWVFIMTLGTIIPSEWAMEKMNVDMPADIMQTLEMMMQDRWGYIALGLLAPIAEEVVFRGAILRALLKVFHKRMHWIPILLSALIFGAVHGNLPQFIHATVMGLLLGWMYYRTDSILPGVVMHWVNNTVAYVVCNVFPQYSDANLIDIFKGNEQHVWMALGFSMLIFLPALVQLALRLRKAQKRY